MKIDRALVEAANGNGGLLTASAISELDLTPARWRRRVDEGEWVLVAPGYFRHAAAALTFDMQVRAGAGWLRRRGALFGSTSLRWLGVEVPELQRAEFLVARSIRSVPNWMTVHTSTRWSERHVTNHRGVRTTIAARAIVDFAAQGPLIKELEVAIDGAIRLRRTALRQLHATLAELSGQGTRNTVLLRELLLDSGGESYLERRFLRLLREAGLPRPECQVVLRRGSQTIARVDFLFRAVDLMVEVSGRLGHTLETDRQRETRRRNARQFQAHHYAEFTTADVMTDPTYVLDTLASWGVVAGSTS